MRVSAVGNKQMQRTHPSHLEVYRSTSVYGVIQYVWMGHWPICGKAQNRIQRLSVTSFQINTCFDIARTETTILYSFCAGYPRSIRRCHFFSPNNQIRLLRAPGRGNPSYHDKQACQDASMFEQQRQDIGNQANSPLMCSSALNKAGQCHFVRL